MTKDAGYVAGASMVPIPVPPCSRFNRPRIGIYAPDHERRFLFKFKTTRHGRRLHASDAWRSSAGGARLYSPETGRVSAAVVSRSARREPSPVIRGAQEREQVAAEDVAGVVRVDDHERRAHRSSAPDL